MVRHAGDELDRLSKTFQQLVAEAEAESRPELQHYARAQQLLEETQRSLPKARQLADSVGQRLTELNQIAEQSQSRLLHLQNECERIDQLLRASSADRPQSNLRHQQVQRTLRLAQEDAQRPQANWPAIQRLLVDAERDLQTVDQMVAEDLRLADQAAAEIRETRQEVRRCQSFYQMGISPQTGQAELDLRAAEQALDRRDYEQAIQLANTAEQAARGALEAARREAERREQELNRRRTQEAAARVASVLATAAATAAAHFRTRR
jgi:hypothetical protein